MELILLGILGAGLIGALLLDGGSDGGSGDSDTVNAGGPPTAGGEGTTLADLLPGTEFDDIIYGRGGDDTINGGFGNDYLDGNSGDDQVFGDVGDDTVMGGVGNDLLGGGTGLDFLRGGDGDDTLRGGANNDLLEGASNADFLQGDGGDDTLRGGPGKDYIIGNLGNDSLEGGPGDTLIGIAGDYKTLSVSGGDGVDTLEGWGGSDKIVLGSGDQAYGEFATTQADGASDTFIAGSWIASPPATIHDFDSGVDILEFYFDSSVEPGDVALVSSDIGGDVTYTLTFDGDPIVLIPVGTSGVVVTLDNVTVIDIAAA